MEYKNAEDCEKALELNGKQLPYSLKDGLVVQLARSDPYSTRRGGFRGRGGGYGYSSRGGYGYAPRGSYGYAPRGGYYSSSRGSYGRGRGSYSGYGYSSGYNDYDDGSYDNGSYDNGYGYRGGYYGGSRGGYYGTSRGSYRGYRGGYGSRDYSNRSYNDRDYRSREPAYEHRSNDNPGNHSEPSNDHSNGTEHSPRPLSRSPVRKDRSRSPVRQRSKSPMRQERSENTNDNNEIPGSPQ